MEGATRRAAIRAHMLDALNMKWDKSPYELTSSERTALDEMAKAVGWRKSIASPLSLSAAFYVYLCRDAAKIAPAQHKAQQQQQQQPRQSFAYGRGHA